MFRHLIDQVQELVDLHGFPPPPPPIPTVPPSPAMLPPPVQLHDHRWCFLNLENNLFESECDNVIMMAKKSTKTLKKQKPTENSGSNEPLKEEIWRHFPEELHENVIARLPIPTFFRFRSVCQNWNSLLNSKTFTHECARFIPPQPWFYIMTHEKVNGGAMYDPASTKWYYFSVPKMPMKIIFPVASAGGLLCFRDNGCRSFYVCNPLTNSFKELPARSARIWSAVAVEMILNKKSDIGGYQIMLVASNGEYELYDSITNRWTRVGSLPDCIRLPLSTNLHCFKIVAANGLIYFLRSDPYGIVSFDMESKVWKQYLVPPPPLSRDLALVECGGRIMMVGLVIKSAASCVSIWELQKMTLLWKEVDRMPNVMSLQFYGKHVNLYCLGNTGSVMLSLKCGTKNRLLTYDVLKKEWLKVPDCAQTQMGVAIGTAFHPSLTAVA